MGSVSAADILVDFASQIDFSHHKYVGKVGNKFVLTDNKQDFNHLIELIKAANEEQRYGSKTDINIALDMINRHLQAKITGVFGLFTSSANKQRIREMINQIAQEKPKNDPVSICKERDARISFYWRAYNHLGIRDAAIQDLGTIKIISQKLWDSCQNPHTYDSLMRRFFQGEHMLFEEAEDFSLYNTLIAPETEAGAYLRGSSHYDHGTLDGKTGGVPPAMPNQVDNAQYEIVGPQVKALLVGRVELGVKSDGSLIFGKTASQAARDGQVAEKTRKYTFLQTEWAPDDSSFFSANFWKHRVLSFCIYAARKFIGSTTPNVGPYGYGHGDQGKTADAEPTVVVPLK